MMINISKNLSASLEYLRQARGFSQEQLAQAAGLPRTTLAYMESGEGNPSLKTLSKVALALGVSYEELLRPPKPACVLVRYDELKKQRRAQGQVYRVELLPRALPGLQMERLDFAPYALLVGTPHMKGTQEYFTCIKGRISVTVEGESYDLASGDVLAFPGDRKHSYQNQDGMESEGMSLIVLHGALT